MNVLSDTDDYARVAMPSGSSADGGGGGGGAGAGGLSEDSNNDSCSDLESVIESEQGVTGAISTNG